MATRRALWTFLDILLFFPAALGVIIFFIKFGSNFQFAADGVLLVLPEVLVGIYLVKLYDYRRGKDEFFATLSQQAGRRHFWDGTGFDIDETSKALFLKSGAATGRYDFSVVKSIERRFRDCGQIFHAGGPGGVQVGMANIAPSLRNEVASGLFIAVRDLDRPRLSVLGN